MPEAWLNTLISVAPFLLILLLWFFLLRNMKKGGGTNSYSNSIRQAVRDELAPELQALSPVCGRYAQRPERPTLSVK